MSKNTCCHDYPDYSPVVAPFGLIKSDTIEEIISRAALATLVNLDWNGPIEAWIKGSDPAPLQEVINDINANLPSIVVSGTFTRGQVVFAQGGLKQVFAGEPAPSSDGFYDKIYAEIVSKTSGPFGGFNLSLNELLTYFTIPIIGGSIPDFDLTLVITLVVHYAESFVPCLPPTPTGPTSIYCPPDDYYDSSSDCESSSSDKNYFACRPNVFSPSCLGANYA